MQLAMLVSFLGLSATEREAVAACLRVASQRSPRYELTHVLDDARCVIADAEHDPSVELVLVTDRLERTVFVGGTPPAGARAHVPRPIDPARLLRELDRIVGSTGEAALAPLIERAQAVLPRPPAAPPVAAPIAPPAAPVLVLRDVPPVAPPVAPVLRPAPTALLVDDSKAALQALEAHLRPYRFACDPVRSSQEAIERLAERQFDFVFIDVDLGRLSETDGLALCQRIKRSEEAVLIATTVVLFSEQAGPMDRVRGNLAGCDAFLAWPLAEAELRRLMEDHELAPRPRKARRSPA